MKKIKLTILLSLILTTFTWVGTAMAVKTDGLDNSVLAALSPSGMVSEAPSPVPEPATILLFGAGLLGIAYVFRRGLLMTNGLKHTLNPLHVYCRLRDMGIGKGIAISFCIFYEKAIFKLLVGFKQ